MLQKKLQGRSRFIAGAALRQLFCGFALAAAAAPVRAAFVGANGVLTAFALLRGAFKHGGEIGAHAQPFVKCVGFCHEAVRPGRTACGGKRVRPSWRPAGALALGQPLKGLAGQALGRPVGHGNGA